MNADAFWERVNAALDERRDPLEDPLVQRELEGSPDRFGELERLLRASSTLESAPKRERRRAGALIAAGLVAMGLTAFGWFQFDANRSKPLPGASSDDAQAFNVIYSDCVVSFEAVVSRESALERTSTLFDGETTTISHTRRGSLNLSPIGAFASICTYHAAQ
jgi:hypothetical protein